ncbi:MAG: nitroreductase family protein [Muribaculaceae bacterium]|nr:nitroreductase family protein [Muribaculaceae bacterium]
MNIKGIGLTAASFALTLISASCTQDGNNSAEDKATENQNAVIETIMSRRSVRAYEERVIPRDTMELITECGINAPNGMNKQEWEIRVVDNPDFINGVTELFVKENPDAAKDPGFKNIFRNAPTVVFIGAPESTYSGVNCGLLGENMILAAWSMGIGSCCLGGPVRFMNSEPASEYLKKLEFSEGYSLIYAIGFGYPAESPEAKPRDKGKIMYID